jgi:Holliday junction resolvase RusA-like endonuclease
MEKAMKIIPIKPIPAYSKPYQQYKDYLKAFLPNIIKTKLEGVLCLKAVFYVPFPAKWDNEKFSNLYKDRFENERLKSIREHHKKELESELAVTYSDVNNLAKALLDGLNGLTFDDDMQVGRVILEKRYSISPRTEFTIYSIREQ